MQIAHAQIVIQLAMALHLLVAFSAGAELSPEQLLPTQPQTCINFTNSGDYKEDSYHFQTPLAASTYPKNADCIKVIRSDINKKIELELSGSSHVEESSGCKHDFLEVRDGPYGYSPLLSPSDKRNVRDSRLCGKLEAGVTIRSTGRYMWLRFKSDEVIEHRGVHASYRFLTASDVKQECRMEMQLSNGEQAIIDNNSIKERFPDYYELNPEKSIVDCSIDVNTKADNKLLVSLEQLQVRRDGQCKQHALQIYDGFTKSDTTQVESKPQCNTLEPNTWRYLTANPRAIVRVTARDTYIIPKFRIVFTVVRLASECMLKMEFDCGNEQCIDSRLNCDGHINCPNGRDEENCENIIDQHAHNQPKSDEEDKSSQQTSAEKKEEMSYHPIILGSIGAGFLILTLSCCGITLRQRLRERSIQQQLEPELRHSAANSVSHGHSLPQTDAESLILQTSLHGNSCYGEMQKQNGSLGRTPGTPGSARSVPPATAAAAAAAAAAAPSKVRVSKFLQQDHQSMPDSPIDLSGADAHSYCMQQPQQLQQRSSRSLPRSAMKQQQQQQQQQESFDTSGSSREAEFPSSYRAFPLPPPPPPPGHSAAMPAANCSSSSSSADARRRQQQQQQLQQQQQQLHELHHSRSIPGQLCATQTPPLPSSSGLHLMQQQQQPPPDVHAFRRTPPSSQSRRPTTKLVFQA